MARLDAKAGFDDLMGMTAMDMLELKQKLAQLKDSERREVTAYLLRLQGESPEWKKELSRRMDEMDAGKKFKLSELEKKLGHG